MIKYNNNTIYDWYFDTSNLIKVYRNNAVCYYKVAGSSPTAQTPCFAVVDNITQYHDTEFVDVFDNATEKWYKLNNLNQFEEYGVYASGRNATTYKGKLTIDDDYEYEWNGNSWNNLGEITGSSRLPAGYTELVDFTVPNNLQEDYKYTFEFTPLDFYTTNYYGNIIDNDGGGVEFKKFGICKWDNGWGTVANRGCLSLFNYKMDSRNGDVAGKVAFYENSRTKVVTNLHNYTLGQGADLVVESEGHETTSGTSTTKWSSETIATGIYDMPLFSTINGHNNSSWYSANLKFHNFKVETSGGTAVYNYVPCKRDSDNKVGVYDIVNNAFYAPSAFTLTAGEEASNVEYPKYYTDKSDPENYVTFDTMEEALAYECPWVGMVAFIDGERYTFDSTNTWVKVLEYYKVEDVTPNAASGWTITQSATYNPDATYYDDFDLETTSTSNSYKVAKVMIFGYENFTYYLRTSGYSSYNFVVATNVDELSTDPASISYNDPRAITNTFSWNKAPKSAVDLSNYRRVTYNNLDKNVEHTFYVIFYGRTYSSYIGNATILIPKDQTNENWEQVTFSASTNISGTSKNLYIDGNNSTSGGTNYFYRRWIVGLPSGSHTSYTNYSNYSYCPSVSSATFTSVAGDVRSVNYIYDNISTKTLQIRLVDSNSNVITPSDTVYYSLTKYNSCGVGNTSANSYPRSESMPIGGRFRFAQSSNRHYIYGYQLQTALNTDFYTDNYDSTFDIVYSKLNDEAVTITYVTYDPNDAETPAFKTEVTWPYGGGTTSSTTLTSCDVPYTYSYTVNQTNGKFSADSQTFTAGQAARTITFTLYPNNREFASVADMEAYAYAWEGMKATVNGTKYKYENGEWVENAYSLPDVPFSVNYNAKTYNSTTNTFAKTEGQLVDVDVTITAGTPTLHDTYVTVVANTRGVITGYQNYFNRDNSNPNITIVSKQRTDGTSEHLFANRGSNYNWMYRPSSTRLAFHGSSHINGTTTTTQPVIESIRVDSNRLLRFNNYTDNTTTTFSNFSYGSTNNEGVALFAGYTNSTGEWFQGDFYWIYMSQTTLTDEQIQQVIDYNENL